MEKSVCGPIIPLGNSLDAHQYALPILEDLFAKLDCGTCFAFVQMGIDEGSKEVLIVNTHKGLFRCNRRSFGVR